MFVVDTPVSKKNHDASLKHQGSLKRFLRDLHRTNEKEQSAAAAAKREVARLNSIVGSKGGSSGASSSTSVASSSIYAPPPAPRGTNEEERKRQLKELEALGVALPDEARRELAMVGDWTETAVVQGEREMTGKEKVQVELAKQQKRKFEEEEKERKWNAMDEDERAMRGFSIQTKTYPGQGGELGEEFVPIVFKGKGKMTENKAAGEAVVKEEEASEIKVKHEEDAGEVPAIKEEVEAAGIDIKTEGGVEVKKEESESIGDGLVFKKRKVKNIRKRS